MRKEGATVARGDRGILCIGAGRITRGEKVF